MRVIPIFRTHYSIGKSILTVDAKKTSTESADSAIVLAEEYGLKEIFVVDENLSGVLEIQKSCKKLEIQLIFGLKISCVNGSKFKTKSDFDRNRAQYIIFARNTSGYKRLISIYSHAATEGLILNTPTVNPAFLKENWNNDDLLLAIPFYDGYVDKNKFHLGNHVDDLFFANSLVFFVEDNGLYFDGPLRREIMEEVKNLSAQMTDIEIWETKTIYYGKKEDVEAFQTMKCIQTSGLKPSLNMPNLNHFSSDQFCMESWKEKNEIEV